MVLNVVSSKSSIAVDLVYISSALGSLNFPVFLFNTIALYLNVFSSPMVTPSSTLPPFNVGAPGLDIESSPAPKILIN